MHVKHRRSRYAGLGPAPAEVGGALTLRVISFTIKCCNDHDCVIFSSYIDLLVKFTYRRSIPIRVSRGAFMRRLAGGERERHLRAMEDATSSPGRTRAASPATTSRPGPTTVKGLKAKMPRWCAARRGA